MRNRPSSILIALLLALAAPAAAQQRPAVIVDPGRKQAYEVAVQRFAERSTAPRPPGTEKFREDLGRALEYSGVFAPVYPRAFLGPEVTDSLEKPIVCSDWSQIGAD